jgi:mannosyltransferase
LNKKLLASLFALGIVLRLWGFWILPLWYDEVFSYLLARLPLSGMMTATMGDVHPPLHYLTVWPLIQLGLPDWAIRIPSLVFSILSLCLFWKIIQRWEFRSEVQTLAFGLMVINPVQLYYAQEGRMYALLEFAVLAAMLCMLERRWILLALATAAMLYTDNYGIFYAACIWMAGMIYWRGKTWKMATLAIGIGFLLYAPWIPTLISQTELFHGHHWIPPVTIGGFFYNIHEILMIHTMSWKALVLNELMIFGLLTFGILWAIRIRDKFYYLALFVLAFGPALISFAFSLTIEPILLFRNLIGSSPFLLLIIAQPAYWYTYNRTRSLAMAVIVVPLLVVNLLSFYRHDGSKTSDTDFSIAFDFIKSQWRSGDIVYHIGDESWLFSLASSLPKDKNYLKPNCDPVLGSLSGPTHAALGAKIDPISDLIYIRAWVLAVTSPLHPQCDYDQTAQIIGAAPPVHCWTDASYDTFCVYLVNK